MPNWCCCFYDRTDTQIVKQAAMYKCALTKVTKLVETEENNVYTVFYRAMISGNEKI